MAGKKGRAFFVCPQWHEIAGDLRAGNDKVLAAIEAGRPVARSALRRALVAARLRAGLPFNLDAYIVEQRTGPSSTTQRAK